MHENRMAAPKGQGRCALLAAAGRSMLAAGRCWLAGWLAAAGTLMAWRGARGACGMAHGGDKGHAAAAADEALDADAAGLLLLEGVKIDNFEGWQNAAGRCRGAKGGRGTSLWLNGLCKLREQAKSAEGTRTKNIG